MPTLMQKRLLSTQNIQRAIWIVLILLIAVLVVFGGYYYWDRYVHWGDQSPVDTGIQHLEQAIREDPQNPETRTALAEFYLSQGMNEDALDQAGQILAAFPDNQNAMLISGIAHVRLEQPQEALDPLEQFVALRKDNPMAKTDNILEMAYYFLGESYLKLNKPIAAIAVLEEALLINRTDADALYQLGLAYHANGQDEKALDVYHRAVRLVPDFSEVYTGMIDSYGALGQSDYVAYARGMQAFTWQDYDTAQTHLEFATKALPDFGPAFLGLGLTYEKQGQLDAALSTIQQAVNLNPDDFAAQQALGRIQASMNTEG